MTNGAPLSQFVIRNSSFLHYLHILKYGIIYVTPRAGCIEQIEFGLIQGQLIFEAVYEIGVWNKGAREGHQVCEVLL